jgi:hypothetical protein
VFGLIGIDNVEFVVAEGIAIGADHRDAALRNALAAIEKLAAWHQISGKRPLLPTSCWPTPSSPKRFFFGDRLALRNCLLN